MAQYVQGGMFGGMNFQPIDWGADWGTKAPIRDFGVDTGLKPSSASNSATSSDFSFNRGFASSDFNYLDSGQFAGGSNPEGVGTADDPNKSNFNPNFSSVLKGMMGGPGGDTATCSATNIGGCIKQVETWVDKILANSLIFGLGILLIGAGLFLLAKETNIGQSTIREVRNSIPKK